MIKPVVYPITLDVYKTGSQKVLSMVRGDNKRVIVIALTENDKPYIITEGCTAKFTALKPDGNFIYNDCEIDIKNNTIVYQVTDQTTAVNGIVSCQIRLIGANGGILSAPSFTMVVSDLLYNEEPIVDSSNEFNALTRFLADLQHKLDNGEFDGKSIYIKGSVSDVSELDAKIPTAVAGDGYLADNCHLYVFDGTEFKDMGELRGPQGVSGVYVGSGAVPKGYNVRINPNGSVLKMDTELNAESQNPVTNSAIAIAIGSLDDRVSGNEEAISALDGRVGENKTAIEELTEKHNIENAELDAKFSRVMYGGWAVIGGNDSWTAQQFEEAIDNQLKTWWDAMPSTSVRFFFLQNNTNLTVLAPGVSLIRIYKTGTADTSYGTIETYSYQSSAEGSGLKRNVLKGELAAWEHIDPPMFADVEYRTTERFLGKPVYTKLFSVPAGSSSIDAGIGKNVVSSVVELRGMYVESGVWQDFDNNSIFYDKAFLTYAPALDLITIGNIVPTGASVYVVIKYTKV